MKDKIEIKYNGSSVYKGNAIDLPIDEDIIIQKSIEVFDDDDPCIIHRSYVVKEIVSGILSELKSSNSNEVNLSEYRSIVTSIDIENIENCLLYFI